MKIHQAIKLIPVSRLLSSAFTILIGIVLLLSLGMLTRGGFLDNIKGLNPALLSIQAQRYEFKGVVVSVDRVKRRATIKHEKVEGLMDAMTMPFLVKDDKALEEMQPGDQIVAVLVSSDDGAQWLEKVVVVAKSQKEEKEEEGCGKNR
ncbi:MAG: copper-binding protein [Acidobacteria bacterium]|nr:copper-binding protein [Acidobacteriota bacterium]